MKVNKVHAAVVAALTGVSGLTYQTAFAQEGLEEIVVTATRREQNLQEVPISIVAITGEGLETRGIDNLEEVSQGIPNVLITGGGGGTGGTNFRMRGIPDVGTYIDGVWQVGTAGFLTNEFVEIDRVEVLRGPQGTMFGRDSTGGAIRIWTKRPAEEFGGNISATAGSNERFDVKASLDLPLSERIRTKWTAADMSRDGYIHSQTTGENGGGIDQQVFRGDIVFDATDNLDFRLNYQNDKSEFTEPRVQDAMFRTYDDSNPNWVKSDHRPARGVHLGRHRLPRQPGRAVLRPGQPGRGLSRRPRRPVGKPLRHAFCRTSSRPTRSRSRRIGSSRTTCRCNS